MVKGKRNGQIRLIKLGDGDPLRMLSFEEAVLKGVFKGWSEPSIMWWRSRLAVVLGLSNKVEEEVNLEGAERLGATVVRRFSGGGTVYHDLGNVNISVIVDESIIGRSVLKIRDNEKLFNTIAVEALESLGLEAEERPGGIFIGGYKIIGSAEKIYGLALLHHSSILVSANLKNMERLLKRIKYPTGNITWFKDLKIDEVVEAYVGAVARVLKLQPVKSTLTEREREVAEEIYQRKHKHPKWRIL